ncbi:hypothetical protein [Nonomuraea sp. NPDC005692]|uniref:hypothetical protein n=1 Tax=Nonomuraea sp. NPDC005692 TaxID=3157168 RepID=UPI0033E74696
MQISAAPELKDARVLEDDDFSRYENLRRPQTPPARPPTPPRRSKTPQRAPQPKRPSPVERQAALTHEVNVLVRQYGWRQLAMRRGLRKYEVLLAHGTMINHKLHAVLTIFTGGLWGLMVWWWLPLATPKYMEMVVGVDEAGVAYHQSIVRRPRR